MKKNNIFIILAVFICAITACNKEEESKPSELTKAIKNSAEDVSEQVSTAVSSLNNNGESILAYVPDSAIMFAYGDTTAPTFKEYFDAHLKNYSEEDKAKANQLIQALDKDKVLEKAGWDITNPNWWTENLQSFAMFVDNNQNAYLISEAPSKEKAEKLFKSTNDIFKNLKETEATEIKNDAENIEKYFSANSKSKKDNLVLAKNGDTLFLSLGKNSNIKSLSDIASGNYNKIQSNSNFKSTLSKLGDFKDGIHTLGYINLKQVVGSGINSMDVSNDANAKALTEIIGNIEDSETSIMFGLNGLDIRSILTYNKEALSEFIGKEISSFDQKKWEQFKVTKENLSAVKGLLSSTESLKSRGLSEKDLKGVFDNTILALSIDTSIVDVVSNTINQLSQTNAIDPSSAAGATMGINMFKSFFSDGKITLTVGGMPAKNAFMPIPEIGIVSGTTPGNEQMLFTQIKSMIQMTGTIPPQMANAEPIEVNGSKINQIQTPFGLTAYFAAKDGTSLMTTSLQSAKSFLIDDTEEKESLALPISITNSPEIAKTLKNKQSFFSTFVNTKKLSKFIDEAKSTYALYVKDAPPEVMQGIDDFAEGIKYYNQINFSLGNPTAGVIQFDWETN